jgi:glycosyltransferase involved in cell wall biosynthesis
VYGTLASISTGTKVIFTEHGRFYPDSSSWKRRYINPVLAMLTDRITAISAATKQALVDYEYIAENRIEVIYNGIIPLTRVVNETDNTRQSLGIPASNRVIGTVARLDPIKNHSMMLSAFKYVLEQYPDTHLIIVGDGEERKNLEDEIERLGIQDKVIITGYIPKPVHHLDCMDIFLLSSLSEGTSMTLLEAMSLGKPCVVTDAGGNPEIIVDNINGYVTENNNAEAFAEAIIKLLADDRILQQMGRASLKRYESTFSATVIIDAYAELYLKLQD